MTVPCKRVILKCPNALSQALPQNLPTHIRLHGILTACAENFLTYAAGMSLR